MHPKLTAALSILAGLTAAGTAQAKPARIDVPLPPTVHVTWSYDISGLCGDTATACTDPDHHMIYASLGMDGFSLAHEKGHLFDAEVLTDADRVILMQRMGLKPGPWTTDKIIHDTDTGLPVLEERGGYDCTPQKCPNELFADAYASCRLHMMPVRHDSKGHLIYGWETAYGWTPKTNQQERLVCRTIRNAANY